MATPDSAVVFRTPEDMTLADVAEWYRPRWEDAGWRAEGEATYTKVVDGEKLAASRFAYDPGDVVGIGGQHSIRVESRDDRCRGY